MKLLKFNKSGFNSDKERKTITNYLGMDIRKIFGNRASHNVYLIQYQPIHSATYKQNNGNFRVTTLKRSIIKRYNYEKGIFGFN